MTYQVKTPALAASTNALLAVLGGIQNKTMEMADAKALTAAAGKMPAQITADIKARMAAPKLAEIEREMAAA